MSEAKELYESLGYEVRLEPATKEEIEGDCSVCLEEDMDKYKTIYTRKREGK
ncbi:MAG: hypothetical protein JSV09_00945 [Thermoplasmata archaeon]|nr:MAG: hypothetical protein JSV09_00945 [Thermoplasmata archaeon]